MIERFDHLVLTVRNLAATIDFYVRGLGLREARAADGRVALLFGKQEINLHETEAAPILPRAARPAPGSADFCLIADRPLDIVADLLARRGIRIELGPIARHGVLGAMTSLYLRDPNENLVEISEYASPLG